MHCIEFEQLHQGTMIMFEYAIFFSEIYHHSPTLVSIVRDRVHKYIEWLNFFLIFRIARMLETGTLFYKIMEINRRLESCVKRRKRIYRTGSLKIFY